jgi:dTMP kinase
MFITFEGSEGTGKTSQLAALVDFLQQQGYEVLTPREPGGTPIGEQVRAVLFDLGNTDMQARTEVLLFQASRAQLVDEVIRPYLEQGGIVISDRYADSTLAYQGYGRQVNLAQLRALIDFATGGLKPDLTILLDVPVEEGLQRRARGGSLNRLDVLELEFYNRVRQGYLQMACQEPERWAVVDASQDWEKVQVQIRRLVLDRLTHVKHTPPEVGAG